MQWLCAGVPALSIYVTFFYTAFITLASMVAVNGLFLYWPPLKAEKSSFKMWASDNNARGLSCLSGVLISVGEGIQLMGGMFLGLHS